jgi:capsular polysaccharide transport system permease protein
MAANQPKREFTVVPVPSEVRAPVRPATRKRRHVRLILSYAFMVLLPAMLTAWYLWDRALDQYPSDVGFTVRREETPSTLDILGGLTNLSTGGSSDSDILFEFIQSQDMVQKIEKRIDLRQIYAADYDKDPIFSLRPEATIEILLRYWRRMVQISYAPGTGLIEVRVMAFDPQTAKTIATAIFDESSALINDLSVIARTDATRYAGEELNRAVERLKQAREAMTAFRSRTQIVDPSADIRSQMGLLTTLQSQLAEELISYDLLGESTRGNDPRLRQSEQRIEAIQKRISQEREKFGAGTAKSNGTDYASVVAEFERISVDREFAEQKYTVALSSFEAAQAAADRQNRYLAAFVQPTLAESAEYPRRELILGLVCLFLFGGWSILALVYYALRDRR